MCVDHCADVQGFCLANKLCSEASFRHVANWTDVRGVASLTNCAWSHFVMLPTGRTHEELPRKQIVLAAVIIVGNKKRP